MIVIAGKRRFLGSFSNFCELDCYWLIHSNKKNDGPSGPTIERLLAPTCYTADNGVRSISHPCDDRLTDQIGPNLPTRIARGLKREVAKPVHGLHELPRRELEERSLVPASHGHSRVSLANSIQPFKNYFWPPPGGGARPKMES